MTSAAATPVLMFRDNADQQTNDDGQLTLNGTVDIDQPVTIVETLPSSGIFINTDENDLSNIYINENAGRGYTATITFPDTDNSVLVRNHLGSISMDLAGVGGTWNPGEELGVVLDDGDINLNSLQDEDQTLSSVYLPAVVIGNPLTIHSGGEHTTVGLFAGDDNIDFAQRGILEAATGIVQFTAADINNYAAQVLDDDLFYLLHFASSDTLTSVTAAYTTGSAAGDTAQIDGGNQLTNFASIKAAIDFTTGAQLAYDAANTVVPTTNIDNTAVSMILSAASVIPETNAVIPTLQDSATRTDIVNAMNAVTAVTSSTQENLDGVHAIINAINTAANVADPVPTVDSISDAITTEIDAIGTLSVSITGVDGAAVVVDIFRFGQQAENIEAAATTRHSDAIYRMLLEESGDNTAMFAGSIEYVLLNQLNVGKLDTYTSLTTLDDTIDILITTDSTDEDSVRVNYVDVDSEGILTQIGDQAEAPTHSGIVSFDSSNYKVADTVIVTLSDSDLNTNSETIEVYTLTADTEYGDRIGEEGTDVSQSGRLLDITFDDATWTYMNCGVPDNGLSNTGFTLSETTPTSGIFTGTFQIPANYCTSDTTDSTTTGKDLEVNYVDYSDASGELIEVGDSAGISANTGSVSFDRSVYPVPFDPFEYDTQNKPHTLGTTDQSITGDTVLHIRVNDPDFDVSGSGSDTLSSNTLSVTIGRGSQTSNNLVEPGMDISEISPTAGIFELDLSLGDTFECDTTNDDCTFTAGINRIQQGDIVTVEYTDATDASGNPNTVTDSATFDLRNAVLQTDKSAYIIGGDMILTLIEPDFDLDSDETESYPLDLIEWDSDADILAMGQSLNFDPEPSALRETGDSTGIFQVVIEIPEVLPNADGEALERGEQIDLEYIDYGPAGADYVGADDEDIELTVFTSNFGATVSLDKKVYSWTDKVFITITAPDHNFDSDLIDEIGDTDADPVKISTRENSIDYYRLVETGTDTGIFTGEVILTGFAHNADGETGEDAPTQHTTSGVTRENPAGPTDGYLEAEDVDGITVSFEVSEDDTVIGSAIIRWNIGEIEWAEASYPASGNGLVRIVDPDLNLNPESVDNFDVDVWSDSDPGGISLTVTETNEATGVFEGQVSFTTNDESSGHRLRVAEGDTITAEYEDHTLPDPYDTTDDLDVLSTAIIGSVVAPLERAPVSNARIVDTQGQTLSSVSVDQQVLVSSDLRSGQDKDQEYAYLVQIQDADGVTVLLSWITGTLPAGSSSSPSQSWTPTAGGDYTATVFVWESITNPTALSPSDKVTIQVS